MSDKVKEAFATIKQAMIDDNPSKSGSYAHGWHCNIASMCYDSILADQKLCASDQDAWRIGNEAASRFMKLCFGVETKD